MNPRTAVALAGLEQQHAIAAILGDPRADGAPRRPCAGHDEVEGFLVHCTTLSAQQRRRQCAGSAIASSVAGNAPGQKLEFGPAPLTLPVRWPTVHGAALRNPME